MCGMAGIFATPNKDQNQSAQEAKSLRVPLERMVRHLNHRGPDACGVEMIQEGANALALGHTRLAIIDLSAAGNQPMQDAQSGNWITLNGEIYNFRELRERLSTSHEPWRSASDTEVVLRAYRRGGRACV